MYSKLKGGAIPSLNSGEKDPSHGNLSVLVGYGPRLFEMADISKMKPEYLADRWLFATPTCPGTPILPDVALRYADDVTQNEIANDDIVIQLIADTQFATHRAVVETWKSLKGFRDGSAAPLIMRTLYTGFNRPDGRSWLGFHDGLSNIRSADRLKAIQIDRKNLKPLDYWTANGTYLAFIKISIDLNIWETVPEKDQEKIVGRQKSTGCPLIGVDERGTNLFARGCPVPGTTQVTEKGNERFRGYDFKSAKKSVLQTPGPNTNKGHAQLMREVPDRIFRQGYEFLDPGEAYPFIRVGLNFVSFQGGTDKIYKNIKYGFQKANFGGQRIPGIDRLLSVHAAGLFFVPPITKSQAFPGDLIFKQESELSSHQRRTPMR